MDRIFLVRHGESLGNIDKSKYQQIADHAMPLSHEGHAQAGRAAKALREHLESSEETWRYGQIRLWNSPYNRARQTAAAFEARLKSSWLRDRREHLLLAEQQFGALDGIAGKDVREHYPAIADNYDLCKSHGGKIFARPRGGESRFDVCVRVHQAFGTFHRDCDRHGIKDIIVVAHGTTIRAFLMMWLHLPYEWFEAEPNPKNCSIRLIERGEDKGYIHGGG